MPTFKFDAKKLTKANKIALANTESKYTKSIINSSNTILPTPFNIQYSYRDVEQDIQFGHRLLRGIENKITGIQFKQVSDRLNDIDDVADKYVHKTIKVLIRNLKWNSNVVIINKDDYEHICKNTRFVRDALYQLQRDNIIRLTTDIHKVVINHNELFYGNRDEFIQSYNDMYKEKDLDKLITASGKIKAD